MGHHSDDETAIVESLHDFASSRCHAQVVAASGLEDRPDGTMACSWGSGYEDYTSYHDHEWGVPVTTDVRLYEKMCLEGFQSGLSWLTILRKRENFRRAFLGFDFERVALFTERDVERLMQDAGIIRHRGKINATINNARAASETIAEHGSLAAFFWNFEPAEDQRPSVIDHEALVSMTQTKQSKAMSNALKKMGWKFVGPTTCYALMQASGIVNDHLDGCFARPRIADLRTKMSRPS